MAIKKTIGNNSLKKASTGKKKGSLRKGTIGTPLPDSGTPETPPNTNNTTPPNTNNSGGGSGGDGKNWVKPKSADIPFEPVGIKNTPEVQLDYPQAQVMLNYGKHPLEVVRFWAQNDGARMKNAQPFDPQGGDYSGFGGENTLMDSKRYKDALKSGPGYEGDVGATPKAKPKKPSGDQHASYSPGSASIEGVSNSPTSIMNGMTGKGKVKY
jgi:hypothetical protein